MTQNYSENVLAEILKIGARDRVQIFEAYLTYCAENDYDVEELFEWLDPAAIALLRQSALDSNKVRKCVGVAESALEFD